MLFRSIKWSSDTGRKIFYWRISRDTIQTIKKIGDQWGKYPIWGQYVRDLQERAWNFVAEQTGKSVTRNNLNAHLYCGNSNYDNYSSRLINIMIQCGIWHENGANIVNLENEPYKRMQNFYNTQANHEQGQPDLPPQEEKADVIDQGNGDNAQAVVQQHPAPAAGHQSPANNVRKRGRQPNNHKTNREIEIGRAHV